MGTFLEGAASFERGASCPGELRGGSTRDFLPRLMPESFHPSSLPDRPVIRCGKVSSDGCRPSGCRAQVARLLLCACLLSWEKRGLRQHRGVSCGTTAKCTRGDIVWAIWTSCFLHAFTRLPLGAGDEHEGSKDTPRVEFSRWGVCSPLLRGGLRLALRMHQRSGSPKQSARCDVDSQWVCC